jgi:glycosyltransferase involved in cell wall biosynthesis
MRDEAEGVEPDAAPLVSVVVATYNRAAILHYTLRSLQTQTLTDWEAWVVGDGCTDATEEVVRGMDDSRFHWLNLPTNSGSQSTPNNTGLEHARGRYVAYLGHDDLWFPWHLAALTHAIEEQRADVVHGILVTIGPNGAEQARGAMMVDEHTSIPPSSWLHRHEVVSAVGGWADHQTLALPVDHDLMQRVLRAGKRIGLSPRLSVLKFKSATWHMYDLTNDYPQHPYFEAMLADPDALHDRVLTELALRYARHHDNYQPVGAAFRTAFSRLFHAFDVRLRDHAIAGRVLRWRFQRTRRRLRHQRGLRS